MKKLQRNRDGGAAVPDMFTSRCFEFLSKHRV
jgi:hypothetical protein